MMIKKQSIQRAASPEIATRILWLAYAAFGVPALLFCSECLSQPPPEPGHPRLYFTAAELPKLRALRTTGLHKHIWQNLRESADWCLTLTPRREWIAPVTPDPNYENLYDRFYAIMGDLAVTEHLALAYALSGDERYGEAARAWTLASCRAWKHEADSAPDGAKAYAVTRLLKGVAVAYDAAYDRFSAAERQEIRSTLAIIAQKYFEGYFKTTAIAGPGFHTHHAIVEWASLGVTALALLDEVPQATQWLDATVQKFEAHLLPAGLATDGAQVEGATFWASTMQYRILFMEPLRRVTGRDLFRKFESAMNADLALASIATRQRLNVGDDHHRNVILSPAYGQLNYYAPVLLFMGHEYRIPACQYLARWDDTLGQIQKTRYRTPHGEQLLFELGGYAYLWCDENAPVKPLTKKLSFHFPSVDEAYLRGSWKPDGLLVGVRNGEIAVHAGGQPILIEPADWHEPATGTHIERIEDTGLVASIHCTNSVGEVVTIELRRPDRLLIRRRGKEDWQWWCQGAPTMRGSQLNWMGGASLRVVAGEIRSWEPRGYAPILSVGFGKLKLADPTPKAYPKCTIRPAIKNETVLEVRVR